MFTQNVLIILCASFIMFCLASGDDITARNHIKNVSQNNFLMFNSNADNDNVKYEIPTSDIGDVSGHETREPFALPLQDSEPAVRAKRHSTLDKAAESLVDWLLLYLRMFHPSDL